MAALIILSEDIKKQILDLYVSGLGSTTISKKLNVSRKKIILLVKKNNLFRNRFHSDEFYSNFVQKDGKWFGFYICNICGEKISFHVNEKSLLNREIKKKGNCKKCSLQLQIGEGNPFYNKKHSVNSKNEISKNRKNKGCGLNNAMANPIYRVKALEKLREKWLSGDLDYLRIFHSENIKKRIRDGKIKGYNISKTEKLIGEMLKTENISFKSSYKLDTKIFDFYLPEYNLLIEYNGDYWHCNPKKYNSEYFNVKKNKTAKEIWDYDENKISLAKNSGYNVEVIWEKDYNNNKNIIINKINKYEKLKHTTSGLSQN